MSTNSAPFFSIVIPVYNVEKYLADCVNSVIRQDFDDYEIILVDDGSSDSCPQICDSLGACHPQISVIHKPNGGPSDARNVGVKTAIGQYVTFIDSDDFWKDSDLLSRTHALILRNHYPDLVASDFIKFYETSGRYLPPATLSDEALNGKSKLEMLKYLYFEQADLKISACQKFVKRSIASKYEFEKGILSEDIDWTLSILPNIQTLCFNSKPYYCYRQQREGSTTTSRSYKWLHSILYIIEKWAKAIPQLPIPPEERDIYLGYLAYQLSIVMTIYPDIDASYKKETLKKINALKHLFNGTLNFKTAKVRRLMRLAGTANTCRVLCLFVKARHLIHKI